MGPSLLNILGEFVALKRSPDYKLSSKSNQYLAEAVRQEIAKKRVEFNSPPESPKLSACNHVRTNSLPTSAIRRAKFFNFKKISCAVGGSCEKGINNIPKSSYTPLTPQVQPRRKVTVDKKAVEKKRSVVDAKRSKHEPKKHSVIERIQREEFIAQRQRKISAPAPTKKVPAYESSDSGAESEPVFSSSLCIKID